MNENILNFNKWNSNEKFNLFRSKSKKGDFVKTSKELLNTYCKNLLSESYLELDVREKIEFNFDFYKIKSIDKVEPGRFHVVILTYDREYLELGKISYFLEI